MKGVLTVSEKNTLPCYFIRCSSLCYGAMSPQGVRTAINIAVVEQPSLM